MTPIRYAHRRIRAGALPWLDEDEEIVAATVARPRGPAPRRGLAAACPVALVLTRRRLLAFPIDPPIGPGMGGRLSELVGAVPLADLDAIWVESLPIGRLLTVVVQGEPIELDATASAGAEALAEAFDGAKALALV